MAARSSCYSTEQRSKTTVIALRFRKHAILALDSQTTGYLNARQLQKYFKKFVKPFEGLDLYMGMADYIDCMVDIKEQLQGKLIRRANQLRGGVPPATMDVAMDEMLIAINEMHQDKWVKDGKNVDILVVGAVGNNNPFRIFYIYQGSSGSGSGYEREEVTYDMKASIGSGSTHIWDYMRNCKTKLTENGAVKWSMGAVKLAIQKDWYSGGAINVILIRRGSATEVRYLPLDENNIKTEYYESKTKHRYTA